MDDDDVGVSMRHIDICPRNTRVTITDVDNDDADADTDDADADTDAAPSDLHRRPVPSDATYFRERKVLCPLNTEVNKINDMLLDYVIDGPRHAERVYNATDAVERGPLTDAKVHGEPRVCLANSNARFWFSDDDHMLPEELLMDDTYREAGIPPHQLRIVQGVPYLLLRNLCTRDGLCNGTIVMINSALNNTLQCRIINGPHADDTFDCPRIRFTLNATSTCPAGYRIQFPLKPAFALTINKVQGQSFTQVGVCLQTQCFAHGQLYAALSRATDNRRLSIFNARCDNMVRNVVCRRALLHLQ